MCLLVLIKLAVFFSRVSWLQRNGISRPLVIDQHLSDWIELSVGEANTTKPHFSFSDANSKNSSSDNSGEICHNWISITWNSKLTGSKFTNTRRDALVVKPCGCAVERRGQCHPSMHALRSNASAFARGPRRQPFVCLLAARSHTNPGFGIHRRRWALLSCGSSGGSVKILLKTSHRPRKPPKNSQ